MIARSSLPYFYEGLVESPTEYADPFRDVSLKVELTSPSGKTRSVDAYWDGGRIWRFRVDADEPGVWSYTLETSDGTQEQWLNHRSNFQIEPYAGPNPLYRHGPLRRSDDGTHLVHRDGTPFFWLADTVWNGVLAADPAEWDQFLAKRREQGFTAIQAVMTHWRAFPADSDGERAHFGDKEIRVNPRFFRKLDGKVAAIARHGLVPALVVLWALTYRDPGDYLEEDDAVRLARYIIARYGAYRPVWFLGGDGRYNNVDRWRRIGREVFAEAGDDRALTTLHPSGNNWIGEAFRDEDWFDFIGYQSSHGGNTKHSFGWIVHREPATEWNKSPLLPVINLEPCYEAHQRVGTPHTFTAHDVRMASYYSLLVSPTAGVTYGHAAIWPWHEFVQTPLDHLGAGIAPRWWESVETEGARSMTCLKRVFDGLPWWKLRPAPEMVPDQPGAEDELRFVAAAKAEDQSAAVVYLPQGGEVTLDTQGLAQKAATWYDPRIGASFAAPHATGGRQAYQAPGEGDWLLVFSG